MTSTSSPHAETLTLVMMLAHKLALLQSDPHTAREEREASRRLYEQLMDYKGSLYRRPLTRGIEFIVGPPGTSFATNPGWYYKAPPGPDGQSHSPGAAFNWYGPYPSYRLATIARDERFPRSRAKLTMATILANAENFQ